MNCFVSYHVTIDGVKCSRGIIDACKIAVNRKGGGRVSKEDAEKIFAKAADGSKVTRCERWTLRYCLAHFKWTEAAVTYLDEQMKAATQEDNPVGEEPEEPKTKKAKSHYENVNGMKLDGSPNIYIKATIQNAAADLRLVHKTEELVQESCDADEDCIGYYQRSSNGTLIYIKVTHGSEVVGVKLPIPEIQWAKQKVRHEVDPWPSQR